MQRILCLDVGEKRIGVAVSDETGCIAQPVETIQRIGFGPDIQRITKIADGYTTRCILCGLPLSMNGTEGPQAQKTRAFADRLTQAGFDVEFWDERMTTVTAERTLIEGGIRRKKRRDHVDQLAAVLILQSYLDAGEWQACQAQEYRGNYFHIKEGTPMSEQENNVVELIGEDGETVQFIHQMTLEHEGESYLILSPAEPEDEAEAGGIVIMRISQDDEGEDCYLLEEDDDTLQAVFDRFIEMVDEEEEFEGDEDEDDDE